MSLGAEKQERVGNNGGQEESQVKLTEQTPALEQLKGVDPASVEKAATYGDQMSAWDDRHLTEDQKAWMQSEAEIVDEIVSALGANQIRMGDVGCGNARILGKLSATPGTYVGFDNDAETIAGAREDFQVTDCAHFPDAADYREGLPRYTANHGKMDLLVCLGNTLGTLGGDRLEHIKNMFEHTDVLVVSVVENATGVSLKRLEYYAKNSYDCHINWSTGTITSEQWGESFSWARDELLEIAESMRAEGAEAAEVFKAAPLGLVLVLARSGDTLDEISGESMRRFDHNNLNWRF